MPGVPALPAVAVGTGEAGGRTQAHADGVDRQDEGVNRRSAGSPEVPRSPQRTQR